MPHCQLRIINNDRVNANHHRITLGPEFMHQLAGCLAGNPTGMAGYRGNIAIQSHGRLVDDIRPAAGHRSNEPPVQLTALRLKQPDINPDTGLTQNLYPLPCHLQKRIHHSHHHPLYPGRNQGIGAGRGLAMVATGLQSHIDICSP